MHVLQKNVLSRPDVALLWSEIFLNIPSWEINPDLYTEGGAKRGIMRIKLIG